MPPKMTEKERYALLKKWGEKCKKAILSPETNPDDFITACFGWALIQDRLKLKKAPA